MYKLSVRSTSKPLGEPESLPLPITGGPHLGAAAGGHLWLALCGGSEASWFQVKWQEGGDEVVGAYESTSLDGPSDELARLGVCISAIRPDPTAGSVAWPRRIGGRALGTWSSG